MKTVEELRQIASDMTSDTNNVNKYLSESPRIANFLIGYDYASSHSMESQWIDVKESKKAVFDERKIRMAFKDFIEDVPNGTAREFFRFLIELSYDEQPPPNHDRLE